MKVRLVTKMNPGKTVERAIFFTKLSVALICSWPPPMTATKRQVWISDALWCAFFLSSILLLAPLLYAVYEYSVDAIILGKTVSLSCAVSQVAIKMLVCRKQRKRFQALHHDVENFCKHMNDSERRVLESYIKRCKYGHTAYTIWCYFTALVVIGAPLYLPQTFPTHAKYPFPTERQPLKTLICLHQSLVGFQASGGMAIDCQIGLLLWYAVARFELLTMQLQNVRTERELNACIEKHNEILRFSEEVNFAVRFLILTSIATTTIAIIFGSLNVVTNQPALLKLIYIIVVLTATAELFICAWPADQLRNMSENVSLGAYGSQWFDMDIKMQRKILQIIVRCRKAKTIRINGISPQLSLSYYASYLYTSFSYFTALKVMIN